MVRNRSCHGLVCLFATAALSFNMFEPPRAVADAAYAGPGAAGPFVAENGMVSSSSPYAAMAGLDMLRSGGNAYDAMAVMSFVLTVTEPHSNGIGGGLFMMAYDAGTEEVFFIDGREEAPKALHPDVFRDEEGHLIPFRQRITGGNAVGVPGALAAIEYVLDHHGERSLGETLEPAIRLARQGFVVDEHLARNLESHWDRIENYPASKELFSREDGAPLQAGDLLRNPDLANTFELIVEKGVAAFYEGVIAEDIVRTVREDPLRPGVLTKEDLANYRAVRREPVSVEYRGYQVYGGNMPTSGGVALGLMLNLLEASDYAELSHGGAESVHRFADAQNLAFADRNAHMADADFVDVPVDALLDKDYARERWRQTSPGAALPTPVEIGAPQRADTVSATPPARDREGSTTHFTVVDRHRNVVSVTATIEQLFGAALVVPGRGFLLNNELTDFNAEAYGDDGALVPNAPEGGWRARRTALGEAAETKGGKRPRSSMSPTIVLRGGQPVLALGSPGGSRIIGLTLNVLVNVLDHGMDVQTAINAPRIIARNGPVELESRLYSNNELREDLRERGFEIEDAGTIGSVQAVQISPDGWLYGGADPRRWGLAVGY